MQGECVGLGQEHYQLTVTGWSSQHMHTNASKCINAVVGADGIFLLIALFSDEMGSKVIR